jgi:hypothetical protein
LLSGQWIHPFIQGDCCYWLPCTSPITSQRLLKVSLTNENIADSIRVSSKIADTIKVSHLTPGQAVGQDIFYYAYKKIDKFGMLLKLNLDEMCWQKVSVLISAHHIIDNAELKKSSKGFLYVHGTCGSEYCDTKAHICVFDLRNDLQVCIVPF